MRRIRRHLTWTNIVPPIALLLLALAWGRDVPGWVAALAALLLGGAVLAAVHHAEVIAHKVGEPFGSLVLAVAVTVIEVGLIVTLMLSGTPDKTATLARDTVFAAAMITMNLIVGLTLLTGADPKTRLAVFNGEGSSAALGAVVAVATLSLVLPRFTTSVPGPEFTTGQLGFAAVACLALYLLFVSTQTRRHRDFFLPVEGDDEVVDDEGAHVAAPTGRATALSAGLLMVALVAVVGLSKVISPSIEAGVAAAGLPPSFVGVVIALVVLLPETIAAVRNARRRRVQIGLNLAYGSAMASIGLTIPVMALLALVIDMKLVLGLDPVQIVLLALTAVVSIPTIMAGRAPRLQAAIHLVIGVAFVFLAAVP